MLLRIVNKDGLFIRDDFTFDKENEIALNAEPTQGLYHPKWNFETEGWVEGLSEEELQEIKGNQPISEPTLEEQFQPMMFAMRMLVNKQVDMSEEELLELIDIYEEWQPNLDVKVGEYYKYQDNLYKVIQAHKTQVDWKPNIVPNLFNKVQPPSVIPIWVQPTGGHDAYMIGDKVTFSGKTYESKINANSWSPSAYPTGWKLI